MFALILTLALAVASWRLTDPPVSPRIDGYTASGHRFLDQGLYLEAIDMYRRALTLNDADPEAGYGYLKASLSVANDDTTIENRKERLLELFAKHPQDAHLATSLADLALIDNDTSRAIEFYRWAVHLNGRLPHARYRLGIAQIRQQRWEEAAANLREAQLLVPDNRAYRYDWVTALVNIHEYAQALDLLYADIKQNSSDTYPRLVYAKTLRLMSEPHRSISALKYLKWKLQYEAPSNQPWKFLSDNGFVYLASHSDKLAYVDLQLTLGAYIDRRSVGKVSRGPETTSPTVTKLICGDIHTLAELNPSLTNVLSHFAIEVVSAKGDSCRLP